MTSSSPPAPARPPRRARRPGGRLTHAVVVLPALAGALFLLWSLFFQNELRERAGAGLVDVRVGDALPAIDVEDADGSIRPLRSWVGPAGVTVMVVDPGSPNSWLMGGALAAAADAAPPASPVLLVSVGSPDATTLQRRRSPALPVVVDVHAALGTRFGLRGTPVVLRADARGRVREVRGGMMAEEELRRLLRTPVQ